MFITDIRKGMDSFNGELMGDSYRGINNDSKYKKFKISKLEFSIEEE